MPQIKRKSAEDFGDILASLERRGDEETPLAMRAARRPAPKVSEAESEAIEVPRPKSRLRQLLENISLPWPAGIGGLIGGFGPRPPAPYTEEAAEAESVSRAEPKPEAEKKEPATAELAKTEDQVIAEELGLGPTLAPIDLQRIRRDFAKKNHPDRFEPARRLNAARRMSIANMLIDEQMRQSRAPR